MTCRRGGIRNSQDLELNIINSIKVQKGVGVVEEDSKA